MLLTLHRAWTICGLAIRQALTLGLHVRSEADDLDDDEQEHRVRTWWSLYSLECALNETISRPSCISDTDISTPLPINLSEDDFYPTQSFYTQGTRAISGPSSRRGSRGIKGTSIPFTLRILANFSFKERPAATYSVPIETSDKAALPLPASPLSVTPSTCFIYHTQLSIILHEIVTQLYCAATIKVNWSDVQNAISRINHRLSTWATELPEDFIVNFNTTPLPNWADPCFLPRISLAMLHANARMLLFRPCLCRFEARSESQPTEAKAFNQEAVENCVFSARRMISLISWSSTSVGQLYAIRPWWKTIHYICEALSVLFLEMAFRSQHMPGEASSILDDAQIGIKWLSMMSHQSISARKAWEIYDKLIRVVAPLNNYNLYNLPLTALMPPGYNWRRPIHSHPHFRSSTQGNRSQRPQIEQTLQSAPEGTTPWTSQLSSQRPSLEPESAQQSYSLLEVGNRLEDQEALISFVRIGNIHGHYDDDWQYIFESGGGGTPATVMAAGENVPVQWQSGY